MDYFQTFLAISLWNLNLFSFILGMLYTLLNITWGNPRRMWFQVVFYFAAVSLFYYIKAEYR